MRTPTGSLVVIYASRPGRIAVTLATLPRQTRGRRTFDATWIDPETGARTAAGTISTDSPPAFATPAGWADALLVLVARAAVPPPSGTRQ
jgi:hypothetical protein